MRYAGEVEVAAVTESRVVLVASSVNRMIGSNRKGGARAPESARLLIAEGEAFAWMLGDGEKAW
jgi:hypothetical protein